MSRRSFSFELFDELYPAAQGPYFWEHRPERDKHHWRIHDSKDMPVGWADSIDDAVAAVAWLNHRRIEDLRSQFEYPADTV